MTAPTTTLDLVEPFLGDVERWRVRIAESMARQSRHVAPAELWAAAQRTIDGLVFLRLGEDRGLEEYGALRRATLGAGVHQRVMQRFDEAEARYGGGLFRRATPDRRATEGGTAAPLTVEDEPLRDVLGELYDAQNGYELSLLPADVLGRVYERFLATDVRLQASDTLPAPKPEARKVGGVFYTPGHIVDYIVEHTLGVLLACESPAGAAHLSVLDPACGSGSFLLGAYQALLDWHLGWYLDHGPDEAARGRHPALLQNLQGDYRLTLAKKREILENSIFGVDVDEEAIRVAKLSLLLQMMAGERADGDGIVLPDLERNIRVGHSLIDPEADHRQPGGRGAAAALDLHPFNWRKAFPHVFSGGGFDVVIGNPPYLSFGGRHAVTISKELRRYYAEHYESGGWPTAHTLFLERSIKLLSRRYVSLIMPDQVGHLGGYASAREIAGREAGVVEVRYWGEHVFRGVTTPALTVILDKQQKGTATDIIDRDGTARSMVLRPRQPWSFSPAMTLIDRFFVNAFSLGKLVGDCGIRTTSAKDQVVRLAEFEGNVWPALEGKLVSRYGCCPPRIGIRTDSKKPLFISREERYRQATFVIRQTAAYPIVGPHEHALYFRNSLLALFSPSGGPDVRYLVALLNSKLLRFVYTETVRESHQRVFPQVKVKALQSLPMRKLDLTKLDDKQRHDEIVALAEDALVLQRRLTSGPGGAETRALAQSFQIIDEQIDHLVYDLYGLSTDERTLVDRSLFLQAPEAEPTQLNERVAHGVEVPA